MDTVTIIVCIAVLAISCLIVGAVIRHCKKKAKKQNHVPPPLPQRRTTRVRETTARATKPVGYTRTVPPRTAPVLAGPRGIRPDQFPACPFCKERNHLGEAQHIFWDNAGGQYRCSRNHKFQKNGKPIV